MAETAAGAVPVEAPPLTHRRVLAITLPVVLSNATVPILGAVDTAVVGQMGAAAPIGAVRIGAIILAAIDWASGFRRMGTTGLTAQAWGAKDHAEVDAMLSRALMVGGAVFGLASSMLDGIFIGATRTADMRDMMAVAAAAHAGAAALVPAFGNRGLRAALLVSFVARAVTLGLRHPAPEAAADGGPARG